MGYGELISTAFRISRDNRYLWFSGFFAGTSSAFNLQVRTDTGGGSLDVDPAVVVAVVAVVLLLVLV